MAAVDRGEFLHVALVDDHSTGEQDLVEILGYCVEGHVSGKRKEKVKSCASTGWSTSSRGSRVDDELLVVEDLDLERRGSHAHEAGAEAIVQLLPKVFALQVGLFERGLGVRTSRSVVHLFDETLKPAGP